MVAPATGRPGEEPYQYDAKSLIAGIFVGRGIKGHGNPDISPVSFSCSAPLPDGEWKYDNRSFKLGLAIGMLIHVPGQGNAGREV